MPPKPTWKPIVLGDNDRLETLMPNLAQNTKSSTSGVMQSPVKISDTMRGGRLSGTRNRCSITGSGPLTSADLDSVRDYKFCY